MVPSIPSVNLIARAICVPQTFHCHCVPQRIERDHYMPVYEIVGMFMSSLVRHSSTNTQDDWSLIPLLIRHHTMESMEDITLPDVEDDQRPTVPQTS